VKLILQPKGVCPWKRKLTANMLGPYEAFELVPLAIRVLKYGRNRGVVFYLLVWE
jgi:hypothetical protein